MWYEYDCNKINMHDYLYYKKLPKEEFDELFLKNSLIVAFILAKKLESLNCGKEFKIISTFGVSKFVDAIVTFYQSNNNKELFDDSFVNKPLSQGIMVIKV